MTDARTVRPSSMLNALLSIGLYVGLVLVMAVVLGTMMPRGFDSDPPDEDR